MWIAQAYIVTMMVYATLAAPQGSTSATHEGTYEWAYETANEIVAGERGYLKGPEKAQDAEADENGYTYTAPDGTKIRVPNTPDNGGFVPRGNVVPKRPRRN